MDGWRRLVRAAALGLLVLVFAVVVPVLAIVPPSPESAGWGVVGLGAALVLAPLPLMLVARAARRLLGLDRLRPGTCPFTGEAAIVVRYPVAAALGRLTMGLGLLTSAGGCVAVAVGPLVAGVVGWSVAALLPAAAIYVLTGPRRVVDLLAGRTRRGGVWLTSTGLVHRSWESGVAVRWDDLVPLTLPAHGDVEIEAHRSAPDWVVFPTSRPPDYEPPDRIPAATLGRRPLRQLVELADRMSHDPAARATIARRQDVDAPPVAAIACGRNARRASQS